MSNYASGPISGFTEKVPTSSDIIPLVDTTDPLVKNKKATVGNIFKAVPYSSGTTNPAIAFGSSNNSGIFSPNGTQVGIRVGTTSSLLVSKNTTNVLIRSTDNSIPDLDLNLQAHGAGKINFGSPVTFTSNNFIVSSPSNADNNFKFDVANVLGSVTLGVPGSGGTIVTETATQTLFNKTFSSTTFIGTFAVNATTNDFVVTGGKVGIGIASPDYKLHVSSDIKVSGQTPGIRFTGLSSEFQILNNNSNSLDIVKDGTTTIISFVGTGITISNLSVGSLTSTTNIDFVGNGTTNIRVTNSGSLGINTLTPQQKLDVTGAAIISGGLYRPDNSTLLMNYNDNTTYHYSTQEFKTGVNSVNPNVIITSLGLVGVGKSVPTVPLDVSGRVRSDSIIYAGGFCEKIVTNALSAGTLNLDFDAGTVFSFLLNQNINNINFSFGKGSPDSNTALSITLIISHDGNPYSINWNPNAPSSYRILWVPAGGFGTGITASTTAPTLQTAGPGVNLVPSKDYITLTSYDGGLTFLGRYIAATPAF